MIFSQTAEYAIRAMSALTRLDGMLTVEVIAREAQVPSPYLAKILQQLSRAGLVVSTRGKHGGHKLARPSAEITLLDVIEAVDPIKHTHECPLHNPDHANKLCPLHASLLEATTAVETSLAKCKLSSVMTCDDIAQNLNQGEGI